MLVDTCIELFLFPDLSPFNICVNVEITTNGTKVLGESGYSLTCDVTVTGADAGNPSITYQWTKNNGTQTQVGTDRVLSFSPLRLSDAGQYTCQATVSPCNTTGMDTQDIILQSELETLKWWTNVSIKQMIYILYEAFMQNFMAIDVPSNNKFLVWVCSH